VSGGDLILMNRDHDNSLNLAVGEPFFLQNLLHGNEADNWYERVLSVSSENVPSMLAYPAPAGDKLLLEELGWMYPGKHVVVTQGAKGGLFALMSVLRKKYPAFEVLHHSTDLHWPTHKTLAKLTGWKWNTPSLGVAHNDSIRLMTAPNNPDGSEPRYEGLDERFDIWDAAYASPIYGFEGPIPFSVASVWSAAKQFGLSGYRIGWVVTGEQWLADELKFFVEATSSGVSRLAQKSLAKLLLNWRVINRRRFDLFHAEARAELLRTAAAVDRVRYAFDTVEGAPITGKGMYAWVKLRDRERFDHALGLANAKVLGGEFCGGTADWVRISLGHGFEYTARAFDTINQSYHKI